MKVIGLDEREYVWNLTGYTVYGDDIRPRSSYHLRCRNLIKKLYPTLIVLEEVPLPGSGNLKLDFYIHSKRLAVEVQGEQHYEYSGKFHSSKVDFLKGKARDATKRRWCEVNNIRLIELDCRQSDEEWGKQILGRTN